MHLYIYLHMSSYVQDLGFWKIQAPKHFAKWSYGTFPGELDIYP